MIAIKDGRLVTVSHGIIEKGSLLIENGKITAIGNNIDIPENAEIINANGKWVTPGLIDAHTHISALNEPSVKSELSDLNEYSSPLNPHVRIFDSFDCRDSAIEIVRNAGFTTCYTTTGGAPVINGTGIAIKTKPANTVYDMYIPGTEQMKMALGENPKWFYGAKGKAPMTRLGVVSMIRETLFRAREYSDILEQNKGEMPREHLRDFKLEALVPLIRGEMKARIHCHKASDIVTAITLAEEFNLKFAMEHVTEGYMVAEYMAEKNVECVVGPITIPPMKMEVWNAKLENAAILEKAGVNFCLMEDAASSTRYLPMHIGLSMAYGLSEEMAFKSVTINPAKLLGLENRIGTLEAGKDADIAIFDGHPFSNFTICKLTMIDGVIYRNLLN